MDVYIQQALVHLDDRKQYQEISETTSAKFDNANYRRILRSTVDNTKLDSESLERKVRSNNRITYSYPTSMRYPRFIKLLREPGQLSAASPR
jgi:hypothetical protein